MSHKVIIITGASGGIGSACARTLIEASPDHHVVLVGRSASRLHAVADSLPAARVLCVPTDVTEASQIQHLVDTTLAQFGRIDVLINNAGMAATGPVESFPPATWNTMLSTNLTSVFLCCQAVIPTLKSLGGGLIVNMASVASRQAFPEWSAYCATRFGLVGFSRALAEEVRSVGIHVSLIFPGSVNTPLWEKFPNTFNREAMLSPDDVARAVSYVVGQPPRMLVDEISLIHGGGTQ